MTPQQYTADETAANSPAVVAQRHDWLDEADERYQNALHDLARCDACGQTLPEVTG